MGSDFDNEESGVPSIKRYWAVLYVFKFYNSNDIFFSCTVTVCPSGSSSCDIVSILGECLLISSLPGKALRTLNDIARLAERNNMRSQSRAW